MNRKIIIIWLTILVFLSYGKSLGLSLYGDDWLTISRYFAEYGPHGIRGGYLDSSIVFSNYGPQFLTMGLAYAFFRDSPAPYFYVSLFLRILVAVSIYWFSKKLMSGKVGFVASSLFAVSSVGAETTDWVYNFSSYLGIAIGLFGLTFFIWRPNIKKLAIGLLLAVLAYLTVIIRLFIMPILLFLLEFFLRVTEKKVNIKQILLIFIISFFTLIPFILIKIIWPGIGFQSINQFQMIQGFTQATAMLSQGKWDFLLTPFTILGTMLIPMGFRELSSQGWKIYPLSSFILSGTFLFLLTTPMMIMALRKIEKKRIIILVVIDSFLLLFLRAILKFQENSILSNFVPFSWTFIGIILFIVCIFLIIRAVRERDKMETAFYLVGTVFTLSFLFPWSNNPGYVGEPTGRYSILPSVGMAIILGGLLVSKFQDFKGYGKLKLNLQILYITIFMIINIISSNIYFSQKLQTRSSKLNNTLFSQIKATVKQLPPDQASFFYFEHNQPEVYEQLLRFGFGYHMQVLYNSPFDGQKFPYSVATKEDLISAVTDPKYVQRLGYKHVISVDHIFAFRLIGSQLIDITNEVRDYLDQTIQRKSS